MTCMRAWMSSKFAWIRPWTTELAALQRMKTNPNRLIIGPLTFREKVARYKLLKGAKLIQPSIPNISPDRYLEYFKEGTVDDAQADFLTVDPDEVTFSQERQQLEARIGDHITLTLSKLGRYNVPALTIYTLVLSRGGHRSFVTEVINYAEGIQEEPPEEATAPEQ